MNKRMKQVITLLITIFVVTTMMVSAFKKNVNAISAITFNENFANAALAQTVAENLGKNASDFITSSDIQNLTYLNISSHEGITDLTGIEQFTSLRHLSIENCPLHTIPENIGNLTDMRFLVLMNTNMTRIPDSIGNMEKLKFFSLHKNKLTELPASIGSLISLEYLDVSNNKLIALPDFTTSLVAFRELDASGNNLRQIPESIQNLQSLQTIKLGRNQITQIPDRMLMMNNINYLELQKNQISELPENIGNLNNLYRFDLSYNQLTTLPDSFSMLNNLFEINLRGNKIQKLPRSMSEMREIYGALDLAENNLTEFPSGLEDFIHIQSLILDGNQLSEVPSYISQLTNLRHISLSNNNFTKIPNEFLSAKQLSTIELNNNNISEIPIEFDQVALPNLAQLSLIGNKISSIPTFNSDIHYFINLSKNRLTELIPDCISHIDTTGQDVELMKITFEREQEDEIVEFDLYDVLPTIFSQYKELKSDFYDIDWTIVKPNGSTIVVNGYEENFKSKIEEIISVDEGEYILKINIKGDVIPTSGIVPMSINGFRFLAGSEYRLPIEIKTKRDIKTQSLMGSIYDKETKSYVEGATVELKEIGAITSIIEKSTNGKYEFLDLLPKTYEVIVKAKGYVTIETSVVIPDGEVVTKDFYLYQDLAMDEKKDESKSKEVIHTTDSSGGNWFVLIMFLSAGIILLTKKKDA